MGDRSDSAKICPVKPVYYAEGVFWKQKLEHHTDVVHMSFNGAVYLPVNPATIPESLLKKDEYADKISKGVGYFPIQMVQEPLMNTCKRQPSKMIWSD